MDSTEITDVSDKSLCNPYVTETTVVMAERTKRNLGDCTPAHRQCIQMGFAAGTNQYLQCRSMLLQAGVQQNATDMQAYSLMMQQGIAMQKPPTVNTTTCTGMGNTVNCMGVSH